MHSNERQALAYDYIRTLIHRPAVGSTLGFEATGSVISLASSSKHIIQIIQLLEERRMAFSFCLDKNGLLLLAGLGLLYQGLELDSKGRLIQDSQRLMCSVIDTLERKGAPGSTDFKRVACAMNTVDRDSEGPKVLDSKTAPRRMSDGIMPAPKTMAKTPRKQLQALASRFTSAVAPLPVKQGITWSRRSTVPNVARLYARSDSQNSISSAISDPTHRSEHYKSGTTRPASYTATSETPNLDYLSFGSEAMSNLDSRPHTSGTMLKDPKADHLTGPNSEQQLDIPFNSLFPSPDVLSAYISTSSSGTHDWGPDMWTVAPPPSNDTACAHSVLSFSEEEITCGEELSTGDLGVKYRGIAIPSLDALDGFDGNFRG